MPLKEEFERAGNKLFRWRSYLPLFVLPLIITCFFRPEIESPFDTVWDMICLFISLAGLVLRILTVGFVPGGTSGRNTTRQKAKELNTAGMYSVVRHPLYLANGITWLGMVMFSRSPWCILASLLVFWIYYERIMFAEEEFLRNKFGDAYVVWAERTPAFIPKLSNWRSPDLSFSIKTVMLREHTTFFIISFYYSAMDSLEDFVQDGIFHIEPIWIELLIIASIIYLSLWFLTKRTSLLKEINR